MSVNEDPFDEVLRVRSEPYRYWTEIEVHRALTRDAQGYFGFVLDALSELACGRATMELPAKQLFTDPGDAGDFRVMPCVVRRGGAAMKTVKLVGTNRLQRVVPGQITVGKALVLHPEENFITHILEACLLSSARTGLGAALAMHLLAGTTDSVAVIGSGRVGYYAAYFAATACKPHLRSSSPARPPRPPAARRLRSPGFRVLPDATGLPH
jgi:ornithine cyclodeaminase/alanine dehydrogenase-like protein (mu-crystallin family)